MQDIEDQDIPNHIGGSVARANIFQGIPARCFGSPVPGKYIMETINLPELVALRRTIEQLRRGRITPNPGGSVLL
jgi:hypothetical protein